MFFIFRTENVAQNMGKGEMRNEKNFEGDEDNKVKEIINFKFVCEVPCPK